MVKRLGALTLVAFVATTATAGPAAAEQRLSIDRAKHAIRTALRAEFQGGVQKGSLRLDCAHAGAKVRCGVGLDDRRDRPWSGHASARIARPGGAVPRVVTQFRMRRTSAP
jgi:hypothetical protein